MLPIEEIQRRSLRQPSVPVTESTLGEPPRIGQAWLQPIHRLACWLADITAPYSTVSHLNSDALEVKKRGRDHLLEQDRLRQGAATRLAVARTLEVLKHQIHAINADVESSVVHVCQGFQGMAQRAQTAVEAAKAIMESKTTNEGKVDLITEMRQVVTSMLDNIHASGEFSQSVSQRLTSLDIRLESVEEMLIEVDELAMKAKIVALNAQIEAARLGKAGVAFGIVAQESKDLSLHAVSTNRSVRTVTSETIMEARQTSSEIQTRIANDARCFAKAEEEALQLLNAIHATHQQLLESLGATAAISRDLQGDIARAVMSMQFQDRVSQRLGHVVHSLELLRERSSNSTGMQEGVDEEVGRLAKSLSDAWLREIEKCYTMESERHSNPLASNSTLSNTPSEDTLETFDVELF